MERKFWEHLLMRSESSRGAKVPWNEGSWTFRSPGAYVPRERKFSLWTFRSRERKCRGTKRPDTMWTTRTPLITAVTQTRTTVINNTTCI